MSTQSDQQQFERYKQLLEAAKKYKTPPREKTFFDTAIRNHYENPTTELIEFFLNSNESHELGDVFWKGFCDALQKQSPLLEMNLGNVESLERECVTQQGNRIDLLIETDSHLILVEAKIYHHQNNPFHDYVQYAQSKVQLNGKQILGIILSISGKSEARNWLGLSYQQLVNCVRPFLAEQMLINPMNKWNLFAREFLLHLESYYRIKNLDMNRIQFVLDHYKEIEDLEKLKTNAIKEVVENIGQQLNQSIEDYESYNKYEPWGGIRFYNQAWTNKSNTTLYINSQGTETTFSIRTYVLNLPEELEQKALVLLDADNAKDPRFVRWDIETYRSGKERWLCVYWLIDNSDIQATTDLILEKAKSLDEIENTLRVKHQTPA